MRAAQSEYSDWISLTHAFGRRSIIRHAFYKNYEAYNGNAQLESIMDPYFKEQ